MQLKNVLGISSETKEGTDRAFHVTLLLVFQCIVQQIF